MSTAMLSQPATVSIPTTMSATAAAGPASPTKKRRRRAPATGAAEDCFSCRAAGVKCDRRRPYCGPCLDNHTVCAGYRTQLTWGVGVASRGKLRGMSLPVHPTPETKNQNKVTKKTDDKSTAAEERAKRMRSISAGADYSASNVGKLSIITNYDFVNMEHPSAASSATSRASSTLSAAPQSAVTNSPALSAVSARAPMPSQRLSGQRSPQAGISPPYSASSQPSHYHSPIPPPQPAPHHHHQPSPQQHQYPPQQYQHSSSTPGQYHHKPPFAHVSLPPHQQPTPSMLLSPTSEYDQPTYPTSQPPSYSAPPSTAPLYDMVTGVSSSSYHASPSMTATTSGVSYASMPAPMHANPRMMGQNERHHAPHHQNGQNWNGTNMGNLHHHQHVPAGNGNLSDLLYDEDMLGTF